MDTPTAYLNDLMNTENLDLYAKAIVFLLDKESNSRALEYLLHKYGSAIDGPSHASSNKSSEAVDCNDSPLRIPCVTMPMSPRDVNTQTVHDDHKPSKSKEIIITVDNKNTTTLENASWSDDDWKVELDVIEKQICDVTLNNVGRSGNMPEPCAQTAPCMKNNSIASTTELSIPIIEFVPASNNSYLFVSNCTGNDHLENENYSADNDGNSNTQKNSFCVDSGLKRKQPSYLHKSTELNYENGENNDANDNTASKKFSFEVFNQLKTLSHKPLEIEYIDETITIGDQSNASEEHHKKKRCRHSPIRYPSPPKFPISPVMIYTQLPTIYPEPTITYPPSPIITYPPSPMKYSPSPTKYTESTTQYTASPTVDTSPTENALSLKGCSRHRSCKKSKINSSSGCSSKCRSRGITRLRSREKETKPDYFKRHYKGINVTNKTPTRKDSSPSPRRLFRSKSPDRRSIPFSKRPSRGKNFIGGPFKNRTPYGKDNSFSRRQSQIRHFAASSFKSRTQYKRSSPVSRRHSQSRTVSPFRSRTPNRRASPFRSRTPDRRGSPFSRRRSQSRHFTGRHKRTVNSTRPSNHRHRGHSKSPKYHDESSDSSSPRHSSDYEFDCLLLERLLKHRKCKCKYKKRSKK